MVSKIKDKDFKIFFVELWVFLAFQRVHQEFSTTYEDFIGSIFHACEMAFYIRAVREQMQLKFLACLTETIHSAYSPYAPNELNLALTQ